MSIQHGNGKHCEHCGAVVADDFRRFIVNADYMIFLDSPHVSQVDPESQTVRLVDGTSVTYTAEFPDGTAVAFQDSDFTLHYFCSDKCISSFRDSLGVLGRSNLSEKTPLIDFRQLQASYPIIAHLQQLRSSNERCAACKMDFPFVHNEAIVWPLQAVHQESGSMPEGPKGLGHCDIVLSDIREGKQSGIFYGLQLPEAWVREGMKPLGKLKFCSNECVHDYCCREDVIVVRKSSALGREMGLIFKHTRDINRGLGNPYEYRPQRLPM